MRKLLLGAITVAFAGVASASTLYGLSSEGFSQTGMLWTLNSSTGAATNIGPVTLSGGGAVNTSIVGLAYLDGALYATDCFNSTGNLFGSMKNPKRHP